MGRGSKPVAPSAHEAIEARSRNRLEWRDISFSVTKRHGLFGPKERKTILHGVSGSVGAGELCAILGPSGAGKTTLLNTLTHEAFGGTAHGTCTLNGTNIDERTFHQQCCIVAQQDSHWAFLRCRETVDYAAQLYMPSLSRGARHAAVDALLARMGLSDCADTRVGNAGIRGLSGGQKRRLSLALALIKKPAVIFLDEPTSGLDAAAAMNIMSFIKELATEDKLIVCATIHQPSTAIYNMFDTVMVLSAGRVAYAGDGGELVSHFQNLGFQFPSNTNPADWVLECVNHEFTDEAQVTRALDAWESDPRSKIKDSPAIQEASVTLETAGLLRQTGILIKRHGKLTVADPTLYLGRAVMFIVMTAFFSVVYIDTRTRSQDQAMPKLFLMMWCTGVPTNLAVVAVLAYSAEFTAIKREHKNGMVRPVPFLLANLILQLPAMVFLSLCGVSIGGYAVAAWNPGGFALVVVVFALILWAFECIAQLCSVFSSNPLLGMLAFMLFWFVSFLFAGVMVAEKSVVWPFRILPTILPLKWGLRSMAYLEYTGTSFEGATLCPEASTPGCLYHGSALPGWACAWSPAERPCVGVEGWQVLDSIGVTFESISSRNSVLGDALIVLAIGVTFKVLFTALFLYKASRATKLDVPRAGAGRPGKGNGQGERDTFGFKGSGSAQAADTHFGDVGPRWARHATIAKD